MKPNTLNISRYGQIDSDMGATQYLTASSQFLEQNDVFRLLDRSMTSEPGM